MGKWFLTVCLIITVGTCSLLGRQERGVGTITGPQALSGLAFGEYGFLLRLLCPSHPCPASLCGATCFREWVSLCVDGSHIMTVMENDNYTLFLTVLWK